MWLSILGAVCIGAALGLLGSGGSILTVPVLVYVLQHDSKVSIAESLAIVGGIASATAIPYGRSGQIHWRSVVFFGIPGMAGTFGGAYLAKFIPASLQLVLFAAVMLLAAWLMFGARPSVPVEAVSEREPRSGDLVEYKADSRESSRLHQSKIRLQSPWKIGIEGLTVGVVTGLVGVGGGFMIVPALVLMGGLTIRLAVGTSLVIIALKSFTGFAKYFNVLAEMGKAVDWFTISWFIVLGILGSLVGKQLSTKLEQRTLTRVFAVFLVLMSGFVLSQEVPKLL